MTDKIEIDPSKFMKMHEKWSAGESGNASDNGVRRNEMKQFDEEIGLESKARSQVRAGLKIKNEGKRADWLRSLIACLPMLKAEIFGNGTPDMLDQENVVKPFNPDAADKKKMAGGK